MCIFPPRKHQSFEEAIESALMGSNKNEVLYFVVPKNAAPIESNRFSAWLQARNNPEWEISSNLATDFNLAEVVVAEI